ncbi:efflux RND transporter permease subunit [Candidatus Reidiella endopervernicosa]|nr:efflux RND transporter permease subunit [Candidatus Reidiella endopervernicosa]
MLVLALVVLGMTALQRLAVDLLPHLIYPEVRVRILDSGVPAKVMEDRVTRQLEEQLAITEDAISVQSRTTEGRSSVDLTFPYGKDIDLALRDASTRLDRAKRFLPDTIDAPVIYKRDPAQIAILEFIISSNERSTVELRSWTDYTFSKWFLNLPGVAAAEVGGGLVREIQILPDQGRLEGLGLKLDDLIGTLEEGNLEAPGGRLYLPQRELPTRTSARFTSIEQITALPISLPDGSTIRLDEVAQVVDSHEDERLRVRLNDRPGLKLSIQKQPGANTLDVAEMVHTRLDWLRSQQLIPEDIVIEAVSDQSIYVSQAVNNTVIAASSGALLAMIVVYLFLGSLRRTLIIGSVIPIAVSATFILMDVGGLTLNIMTLGGLTVGIGMLVDNTIVMLENIYRHQREGERWDEAGRHAAGEINSAIVASTSTNLAAILPFLFISGLIGLLFRELIFTISAAIFASLLVALTLVPSLAVRVPLGQISPLRKHIDTLIRALQLRYGNTLERVIASTGRRVFMVALFCSALFISLQGILGENQTFLPRLDDGNVNIHITGDSGITMTEMDQQVATIEALLNEQPEVVSIFSTVGGFIFGRSQYESSNRGSLVVQLTPRSQRDSNTDSWVAKMRKLVAKQQLPGIKVRIRTRGVRGIRISSGDDDISMRLQGPDLDRLDELAYQIVDQLQGVEGISNLSHSSEELRQELAVTIDRDRAATLGLSAKEISDAIQLAITGRIVTDYLEGDRSYDIRVRLPRSEISGIESLQQLLLYTNNGEQQAIHLREVAQIALVPAAAQIMRDNQQRIVEVSASLSGSATLGEVLQHIDSRLSELQLPEGYVIYEAGASETLKRGQTTTTMLLGLALFLVFVVMAVQYESLRNPLIILLAIPFTLIGVATGINALELPLSMPVWLGVIMLVGIVVNNAIVLVETIELLRQQGSLLLEAIVEAARIRLRPILMTTLTTIVGLLPLALGLGEGAEMLRPLAVCIVFGLSFSALVTLFLLPAIYHILHSDNEAAYQR